MPAIVYDFTEIASYLRDDKWWPKPEAKPASVVASPIKKYVAMKKKYAPPAKPVYADGGDVDDDLL